MTPPTVTDLKESTEENLKQPIDNDRILILKAIKEHGYEQLSEEKVIDLISSIVYRRIRRAFSDQFQSTNNKEEKEASSSGISFLSILFVIMFIFASIQFYYYITGKDLPNFGQLNKETGKDISKNILKLSNGSILAGPFEFTTVNNIRLSKYCGRKNDFDHVYGLISKYIKEVTNLSRSELDSIDAFTKLNFLFKGPPGTGKTIFVHYLASVLDNQFKLEYLLNKHPNDYNNIFNDKILREKYISEAPSKVFFCEVSPGVINSKWHGESEKNISVLFESAKQIADEDEDCVILIFFDEGDAFFSRRSDSANGEVTSSLKSELLRRIGVRPSDKYRKIFTFCATNRITVFDDGFLRRFGNIRTFGMPDKKEREELVKFLFSDFELTDKEIQTIVALTQGRSHSYISKLMRNYYQEDDQDQNSVYSRYRLKDFVRFLYDSKDDKTMV